MGAASEGVVLRLFTLVAGVLILGVVVASLLVDEGEVVRLTTFDAGGVGTVTGLWVVEVGNATYLRAGSPAARWLARLRSRPEVVIERNGVERKARALPIDDPTVAAEVDRAMRAKYGWLDAAVLRVIDHSHGIPVRVEVPPPTAAESTPPREDQP